MSEMVERVAAVISLSFREEGCLDKTADPALWDEFRRAARAAIEAIREPTSAMIARGAFYCIQRAGSVSNADMRQASDVYCAMIHEALK